MLHYLFRMPLKIRVKILIIAEGVEAFGKWLTTVAND